MVAMDIERDGDAVLRWSPGRETPGVQWPCFFHEVLWGGIHVHTPRHIRKNSGFSTQDAHMVLRWVGSADRGPLYLRYATCSIYLTFGQNGYDCAWVPTVDDRLIFAHERCVFFWRAGWTSQYSESLGSGHEESKLPPICKKIATPVSQITYITVS